MDMKKEVGVLCTAVCVFNDVFRHLVKHWMFTREILRCIIAEDIKGYIYSLWYYSNGK